MDIVFREVASNTEEPWTSPVDDFVALLLELLQVEEF